ncbi:MAG: cytochrome c family protein, partial [Planctomycetota bacterium]|nr:cytochrome c family protein [Planctomycetota bacterium]
MRFVLPLLIAFTLLAGAVAQDDGHDVLLARVRFGRFVTSDNCAFCHSNATSAGGLRDNQGRPVAPYDLWRATMMANAARDPFFLAAMAAETTHNPSRKKEIEAKCLRCHAPMAHEEVRRRTGGKDSIGADVFKIQSPFRALAMDGVSCTLCH